MSTDDKLCYSCMHWRPPEHTCKHNPQAPCKRCGRGVGYGSDLGMDVCVYCAEGIPDLR